MELLLLGSVELRANGHMLDVGPPQQQGVLAALAVDVNQLIPTETLIDRVWGPDPPAGARRTLHTHIARIRRLLEQAGAGQETGAGLAYRSGGYRLGMAADLVDLHRFRDLGRRARSPGCPGRDRVELLRAALALWRGEPLAGLAGNWVERTREGCRQQRLDTTIEWATAELRDGDPGSVIGPVTELLGEYPLVEPLAAVLMRALHATGRTADALGWYATIRQRLVDELGSDPGAPLRAAHRSILRGESTTDTSAGITGVSPRRQGRAAGEAPVIIAGAAQLPPDIPGFAGRDRQLAELHTLLLRGGEQGTAVVISALSGTAGVGKTALAVHWAHQVRDRFPDGQLYVNLRGFDPGGAAVSSAEAIRGFLDALGVPPQRIPAGLGAQTALYRSLLAGRRVLVALDNAADAEQVRPLIPGTSTAMVIVTSRNTLSSLVAAEGAYPLSLDLLSTAEARDLLAHRIGPERVAAEPAAVDEIISRCARLPLALAVAAARAATRPGFPLAVVARELRAAVGALDAFAGEDAVTDVRAVFSWSYQRLSVPAARLFRLLGIHQGPDICVHTAASLAGVDPARIRPTLAELVRTHLISEHEPGRYALHDLMHAYAAEQAQTHDSPADRRAAVHRLLDHYLHTAHLADQLLNLHRDQVSLAEPRPGVSPEHLTSRQQALDWLIVERSALVLAVRLAADNGFDTHSWHIAWTLTTPFDRQGHWYNLVTAHGIALESARRAADLDGQAHAHRGLSVAYTRLGRTDEAAEHLRHALDLYRRLGDLTGQAHTHLNLDFVLERQGQHADALDHAQQALDLYVRAGYRVGEARALNAVGWYHTQLGQHHEALTHCRRALAMLQELGDRSGESGAWDSLGYAHHHLGEYSEAARCYRQALALRRQGGDRYGEAVILSHLGETHDAAGDHAAARESWRRAVDILDELDHPDGDRIRAKLGDPVTGPP